MGSSRLGRQELALERYLKNQMDRRFFAAGGLGQKLVLAGGTVGRIGGTGELSAVARRGHPEVLPLEGEGFRTAGGAAGLAFLEPSRSSEPALPTGKAKKSAGGEKGIEIE